MLKNTFAMNKMKSLIDGQTEHIEYKKINIPTVDNTESRTQLIARIETITANILQQISSGNLPQITHSISCNPSNTNKVEYSSNCVGNWNDFFQDCNAETEELNDEHEESNCRKINTDFSARRSKDKFALTMSVMATAHRLLILNTCTTKRAIYYDLKNGDTSNLAPEQRYVDEAVNNVANFLNCSPWELHILPSPKGLAAGELKLELVDNRTIDCTTPGGTLIPFIATDLISISTNAKFVLVVEKDTVFQKLLEDDCISTLNCILITGKGYPDIATRMLVKLLSEKMQLSVYILVDADPFGVDIMCVYRFGSMTLSREKEALACSNVRWLGIHPSELITLGVNTIPLTEFDLVKLTAIEHRSYMNDTFLKELRIMRKGKAEIENVSSFSRKFLITYISCKIKGNDYI